MSSDPPESGPSLSQAPTPTLTEAGAGWSGGGASATPPRLGRFEILGRLGAGGMGEVYEAMDPRLERRVAIKVVGDGRTGSGEQARLMREARVLARLAHPNIVAIHDAELDGPRLFLAMELVRGADLRAWLAAAPRRPREITAAIRGALAGVHAAHEVGVIHRDLKPDNILVGDDGRVRVADFGIARAADHEAPTSNDPVDGGAASVADPAPRTPLGAAERLTRTGTVVGTPAYMAPELLTSPDASPLADQWALFATAYEAYTGERVLDGRPDGHAGAAARALAHPAIPRRVRKVIARGLAHDPAGRFPDLAAAGAALRVAVRSRLPRVLAFAGGVAAVLVVLAIVLGRGGAASGPTCDGGETRSAAVWHPARRDRIINAFVRSGAPSARANAGYLAGQIDRHVAAWRTAFTDACEATHVRGEQSAATLDLRTRCLDRRLGELDALLAAYSGDLSLGEVMAAPDVVDRLPSVAACADPAQLAAVVPLPAAATARTAIEQARRSLAEIRAASDLARFAAARTAVDALATATADLRYPPIAAEVALWRARLAKSLGDHGVAAEQVALAIRHAVDAGDVALEAEAWLTSIDVERVRGDLRAALAVARTAEVALRRAGEPLPLVARFHNMMGNVYLREGRLAEAEAAFVRAGDAFRASAGADSAAYATARFNLAAVVGMLGRVDENRRLGEEAIAILERRFGPDHLDLAYPLSSIALADLDRGRVAAARTRLERVLGLRRAHLGASHPEVAFTLAHLASVALVGGDTATAEREMRDAIAMMRAVHGGDGLDTAEMWITLADGLLAAGDLSRAATAATAGREVLDARGDLPASLRRGATLTEGRLALARGDIAAASAACTAVATQRAGEPDDEPEAAAVAMCLGEVAQARQARAAARTHLERAATIADGASLPLLQAEARLALAGLIDAGDRYADVPGDRAAARAAATAGLAGLAGFEGALATRVRDALTAWLAAHPAPP